MPVMLSELLNFAQQCYESYGDVPVFMKVDDDPDNIYMAEEQRVMRDTKNHQTAFVLADYELPEEGIGPRLRLIKG